MITTFRKRFRSLPLLLVALLFFTLIIPRTPAFSAEEDDDFLQVLGLSALITASIMGIALLVGSVEDAKKEKRDAFNALWPSGKFKWEWYIPKKLNSAEEAVADIKNVQGRIQFEGKIPSELDVDKFGFRAKMKWVLYESGQEYVPTSGGFFLGWNYIPTYSGTYQPWQKQTPQEKLITFSFKEIESVLLYSSSHVEITTPYQKTLVSCKDSGAASMFINSLYTLAPDIKYLNTGIKAGDFTEKHRQVTGLNAHVFIIETAEGSAADKAGLKNHDIILEAGGKMPGSVKEFLDTLGKSVKKGSLNMKIISRDSALAGKLSDIRDITIKY